MPRLIPPLTDEEHARAMAEDEPGFGSLTTPRGRLPLKAMDVRGRIDGLLSQVTVRQTFVNALDEPLEATYIFPLPDRAAVTRLPHGGGRPRDRGRARGARAGPRRSTTRRSPPGHRAAIAEEERPGVFTLRVGNLMPGEPATVELDAGRAPALSRRRGHVPLPAGRRPAVHPRRAAAGPVGRRRHGRRHRRRARRLADLAPGPAARLPQPGAAVARRSTSTTRRHRRRGYPLQPARRPATRQAEGLPRIRLHPGERLDRDFILRFRLGPRPDPLASSLSLHPDARRPRGDLRADARAAAARPRARARPRDVVFVLDRSGSMEGWKIVAARRAMARMIDTLGDGDRFCVLAFDDRSRARRASRPRRSSRRPTATGSAPSSSSPTIEARGGTEMAEPLDLAVDGCSERREPTPAATAILVLVTDGQVGNEDQILQTLGPRLAGDPGLHARDRPGGQRGVPAPAGRAGRRGVRAGRVGGAARRGDGGDPSPDRHAGPDRTRLEPEGFAIVPDTLVPARLPDLSPRRRCSSWAATGARRRAGSSVRAGRRGGDAWSEAVAAPSATTRRSPRSGRGARSASSRIATSRDRADRDALERPIVATSLRFGVLCRFTAYVAVDRAAVTARGASSTGSPSRWNARGMGQKRVASP